MDEDHVKVFTEEVLEKAIEKTRSNKKGQLETDLQFICLKHLSNKRF